MEIKVHGNEIEKALRTLKNRLRKEGLFGEIKRRSYYEKRERAGVRWAGVERAGPAVGRIQVPLPPHTPYLWLTATKQPFPRRYDRDMTPPDADTIGVVKGDGRRL